MRKVKVGTLGTIEHCFIIKDLAWNIRWNNIRTKRHLVGKFVLDKQNLFCYAGDQHKFLAKGYRVATMTVLSRAKEFWTKKKPPEGG
jgi:hypothetical protein